MDKEEIQLVVNILKKENLNVYNHVARWVPTDRIEMKTCARPRVPWDGGMPGPLWDAPPAGGGRAHGQETSK